MEIQNNSIGLNDIFSTRYQQNIPQPSAPLKDFDTDTKDVLSQNLNSSNIKDVFTPSKEYSKILEIKEEIKNGFEDAESFISMANILKNENIINNNDMIAIDFLAKESPKVSFDEFNKILKSDNLSKEMKGLISNVVEKLEMIDYISKQPVNIA